MVKGVSKNIIEINSTGSEVFEKIVFYVSPSFSSLGEESLKIAAEELETALGLNENDGNSLRVRVKRKAKLKKVGITACALSALMGLTLFLILKFI